jgi:DMSO/TMAO reductase YedYZ molybdopterin-dependent catalytic subunit
VSARTLDVARRTRDRARARQERWEDQPAHDDRTASILGVALGVCFVTAFVTGLISHYVQHPVGWFHWPTRPAGLYRVTQGVHVATGIATIPLLLAKLWSVAPRLVRLPPIEGVAHALARLSLVPLVFGSLFLLVTGVTNIDQWYPWPFLFTLAHYWAAWITMGALLIHVAAVIGVARAALARGERPTPAAADTVAPVPAGPSRRQFLGAVAAASTLLTVVTVGQTVSPLRRLALLAPRRPDVGPQGFPVNRSAVEAGVTAAAEAPGYRVAVEGAVARPLDLSVADLAALGVHEATLPIACVEGWSASVRWEGVRVRDVLAAAGARPGAGVTVQSLERVGYGTSTLRDDEAADPDTLLALRCNGEVLHVDHGYPVRLIGPNRPGVQQTKWVTKLVVS